MVESKAVAAEVAAGKRVNVEGVEGTAEAGLEVVQQGIDPTDHYQSSLTLDLNAAIQLELRQ